LGGAVETGAVRYRYHFCSGIHCVSLYEVENEENKAPVREIDLVFLGFVAGGGIKIAKEKQTKLFL
jgi:hypothetical protein